MFTNNNFSELIRKYFLLILIFTILICILFIPFLSNGKLGINIENLLSSSSNNQSFSQVIFSDKIYWPLPGYTRISSPFGNRGAPTAGATSFHGGIDIPAPAGTNIASAISGKVTRTGFMGSGRLQCSCAK